MPMLADEAGLTHIVADHKAAGRKKGYMSKRFQRCYAVAEVTMPSIAKRAIFKAYPTDKHKTCSSMPLKEASEGSIDVNAGTFVEPTQWMNPLLPQNLERADAHPQQSCKACLTNLSEPELNM